MTVILHSHIEEEEVNPGLFWSPKNKPKTRRYMKKRKIITFLTHMNKMVSRSMRMI